MEGDPEYPNVVAFSVYNTKLVQFLLIRVQHLGGLKRIKKFTTLLQATPS
jgi:hypothetical protein